MNNNKNRKKLENNEYDYDNYDENDYGTDNFQNNENTESKKSILINGERFSITKLIFAINLIVIGSFFVYAFLKNILPLNQRLFYTGFAIVLESILYFLVFKKDIKLLKFISAILMLGLISFCLLFLYYFSKIDNSIIKMNKNITTEENSNKKINNNFVPPKNVGGNFNIYISGIDTYGELETISRSDVNIIASVNIKTGKILLTTIPRDTYVPIALGGDDEYDKLTHAGIYGVESSIQTLENFLGIDISYYARVNFSSLINLVDVLGGVEVYNDEEFTSSVNNKHYPKGKVQLDGTEALAFVRERYNLTDGDFQRGRNQEKVLSAMISKALSPSILLNFDNVLEVLNNSVNTNLSTNKIMDLINAQIFSGKNFEIDSQEITGYGEIGYLSYAMPDHELYMLIPYEESIEKVKKEIDRILKENQDN